MTVCSPSCSARCCSPILMAQTKLEMMTDNGIAKSDREWVERCLTAMPMKEAMSKAPWLRGRIILNQQGKPTQPFFYRCSNFNEQTRKCEDYDNRPSMCIDFPWAENEEPYGGDTLPPDCSFRADLIQIGRKP